MTKLRVLLVEDDDTDALILSEVASQASGAERIDITREVRLVEAIERTRTEAFDVVLLDLGLPDGQGLETFLRFAVTRPQLPVVVLTGTSDGQVAREAIEAGAQDFIVKDELVHVPLTRVLRYAVERARLHADLRASEARFRTLVEFADDALSRTTLVPERRLEYVSPSIEALTGFPAALFLDDPELWLSRVHPSDQAAWQDHGRLEDGSTDSVVYRYRKPDDSWAWLEDRRVPIFDATGLLVAFQAITRDVTAREQIEAALHHALEQERGAVERLRALDSMRATFLQAVSHELRTPLTVIRGFALTLQRHDQALEPARRRDILDRLAAATGRLESLLCDLLDIDRLNRGLMTADRQPTDVDALVERVIENVQSDDHPISVVSRLQGAVPVDGPKVERIVENLLHNAIKHTLPGTPVRVELDGDEEGVLVTVVDHGPGVAAELADGIFEPFVQGPQSQENPSPGTGIGLALVARFAELHGGRAWVEPTPQGGATFRVHLPARDGGAAEGSPYGNPSERPEFVVAETVRELLYTTEVEEIPHLLATAVERMGGTTIVGAEDSPTVLPVDLSVGVGPTLLPAAPVGSAAREALECHLPRLVEDARRAADRCRIISGARATRALPWGVESGTELREALGHLRDGDGVIEVRLAARGRVMSQDEGRGIARAIRSCLRAVDRVFLVEPMRFVVVLPDVTEMGVATVRDRLEAAVGRRVPELVLETAAETVGDGDGVAAYRRVRERFSVAG